MTTLLTQPKMPPTARVQITARLELKEYEILARHCEENNLSQNDVLRELVRSLEGSQSHQPIDDSVSPLPSTS